MIRISLSGIAAGALLIAQSLQAQQLDLLLPLGHPETITNAVITPDKRNIISTGLTDVIVWDLASGKEMVHFTAHADEITGLALVPGGKTFITTGKDSLLKCWSARTGDLTFSFKSPWGEIRNPVISKDGKLLWGIVPEGRILELELNTKKAMVIRTGAKSELGMISISPDQHHAAITQPMYGMLLLDLDTKKVSKGPGSNSKYPPDWSYLCYQRSGASIFAGDRYADAIRIDLKTKQQTTTYKSVYNLPKEYVSMANVLTGITGIAETDQSSVWLSREGTLAQYETNSGKLIRSMIAHELDITGIAASADGRMLLSYSVDQKLKLWDSHTGKLLNTYSGHSSGVGNGLITPDGNTALTFTNEGMVKKWNLKTGELQASLYEHMGSVVDASLSTDGKRVLTYSYDNHVKVYDLDGSKLVLDKLISQPRMMNSIGASETHSARFSPDGKNIVVATDTSLLILEAQSGALKKAFRFPSDYGSFELSMACFDSSGNTIFYAAGSELYHLNRISGKKHLVWQSNESSIRSFGFSPAQDYLLLNLDSGALVLKMPDNMNSKPVPAFGIPEPLSSFAFSFNGSQLLTGSVTGTCSIYEMASGKRISQWKQHTAEISGVHWMPGTRKVFTTSYDYTSKLTVVGLPDSTITFIAVDQDDYFTTLPDGRYRGSPRAISLLSFRYNGRYFPFEQFDLLWNRPDKVLEALGYEDTLLIRRYAEAWVKRTDRSGVKRDLSLEDAELPRFTLLNSDSLPATATNRVVNLQWTANWTASPVTGIQIRVNGVPEILRKRGVSSDDVRSWSDSNQITLSAGINKIQLSCFNTLGLESYKETVYISYLPGKTAPPSKMYFIGTGLNRFQDSTYNLHYAVKDIRDLSALFRNNRRNISIDTFLNENASRTILAKIETILSKATVDDEIVLAFCGHGLLDEKRDFFFAPYEQDFAHPDTSNSISYAAIEHLLSKTPARKKLLLLDACNSGDLDNSSLDNSWTEQAATTAVQVKVFQRGGKIGSVANRQRAVPGSFELMKMVFADLSANNGAAVISAAAGTEFALESKEWNNGAFTWCIKDALYKKKADRNGDGVSISELRQYLSARVKSLTNGRQQPVSRQENPDNDWILW